MQVIICDGASKGNPGQASIGVVIWERFSGNGNQRVKPTHTISKHIGIGTNNDAEWKAVLEAMQYLVDRVGNDPAYIYTDSMLVVKQISGEYKVKNDQMKLYKHKFDLLKRMCRREINISWLPRQLTMLADREAEKPHA